MHIPDALEYILRPDDQLGTFNGLIFSDHFSTQVVRAVARILHEDVIRLAVFSHMKRLDDVWVVHLNVDGALSLGEGDGQSRLTDFIFLYSLQYHLLLLVVSRFDQVNAGGLLLADEGAGLDGLVELVYLREIHRSVGWINQVELEEL